MDRPVCVIDDFKTVVACGDVCRMPLAYRSVDLVFGSPPYEDARTYGVGFGLSGRAWVGWAVAGFVECLRVCRGLVAWVVEGKTRQYRWSAVPVLLMAELHRAGVHLRKPPVYFRYGIPGSGGGDWLKNNYELIVCATATGGRLPWSDNTAMGHVPKCGPGGAMSHRLKDGTRKHNPGRRRDGKTEDQLYRPPKLANPGNVIGVGAVGGGNIGSKLAHENEAPFPEKLAEFFVRSFCPPGGVVLDPFSGSGTTAAVARRFGRRSVALDIRPCQCRLTNRRIGESI